MSRINEWGESLEETIKRSRTQSGLLVYSMVEGEEIEISTQSHTPEGVQLEAARTLSARALGTATGAVEIIDDSNTEDSWLNRVVCLGSYSFSANGIEFTEAGILRGFIGHNQGVVVDLSARHFIGNDPTVLLAEYASLSLEGQQIF